LNVQGAGGIRETGIHTAEPFVSEPSAAEVEVAIRKLKRYNAPGSDQIPAELIQAELHSEVHKLIMLIWNKEELPHQWKESIVFHLLTKTVIKLTVVIIKAFTAVNFIQNFYLTFFSLG
jgi:hypothetical protein